MDVDKNKFFREATYCITRHLEFEKALKDCLVYLRSYMPADLFHLTVYDRGLGALITMALADSSEARRVKIVVPLDEKARGFIEEMDYRSTFLFDSANQHPLAEIMSKATGLWPEHSVMGMNLKVKDERPGNLSLLAKGVDRYTEEHLELFSMLNGPFTISLFNALRFDELKRLKEILADDVEFLHRKLAESSNVTVVGEDFGLREVMDMVKSVARLDNPVLLHGETGVGKEVIANSIHNASKRRKGPFIKVNCGAIPDSLIDSELFGHEKGSFTGATDRKRGCFERASSGTIFLDEIGEMPLPAQVRMLRVLQEKKIQRVGGTSELKLDIRIIAATHQDLEALVEKKLFRMDLWFRLNVFPIAIPPLRDRLEDLPALIKFFLDKKSKEMGMSQAPKLATGAIDSMRAYSWPGNVRELENVIERAMILNRGRELSFENIIWRKGADKLIHSDPGSNEIQTLDSMTKSHIIKALELTDGKIHGPKGAAEVLGINPSTLRHRIKKLNIKFKEKR